MFTLEIKRWPNSRFWTVYINNKLLAVVVYKKGAKEICNVLERLLSN